MKKLIIAAFALTTAASVFAQGTVVFGNRNGLGTTHVYAPNAIQSLGLTGSGPLDNPSGTTPYTGLFIGSGGLNGQYGAATTFAQLLAANGANAPEGSLTPQGATSTFRTGGAAGNLPAGFGVTLQGITPDAPVATLEMVAWDNSSGLYSTWTQASVAWLGGLIAAGKSGAFNVQSIGGSVNTPAVFLPPSFNLYFIPEPSSFALAGLGAAAMLIFRRRK